MCPYCVPGPNGHLERENFYPRESPCCLSPFGLRHAAARTINESLERWIVTHLCLPTQFIIHEFSSKSRPVLTFDSEPREHPVAR